MTRHFLNRARVREDEVTQFLGLIHDNMSMDLYVNDIPLILDVTSKYDTKLGDAVSKSDLVDISRIKFAGIRIIHSDKVCYCFKVGWRFGLFFDLNRVNKLDINAMEIDIARLYKYLLFEEVYSLCETSKEYEVMFKDGWFPFVEILGEEFEKIKLIYEGRKYIDELIDKDIIVRFDEKRINRISDRWWRKKVFMEKKPLLEAGLAAFQQNNSYGYINCIKNLLTEIEGILRMVYMEDTGSSRISMDSLLKYIMTKGEEKAKSDGSLLLTKPFFNYLREVVYRGFNTETGQIDLSRHTVGHGAAIPEKYTKARALQAILTLDQIYFYL